MLFGLGFRGGRGDSRPGWAMPAGRGTKQAVLPHHIRWLGKALTVCYARCA